MVRLLTLFALLILPMTPLQAAASLAPADSGPVVQNPGFECGLGYDDQLGINGMVPKGWTGKVLVGHPVMNSTQMWATYWCDPQDMGWEKLEGHDSYIFLANDARPNEDFVAPPFDAVLSQRVQVTPGVEYSLSAWMTSLCGGSSTTNPCPPGAYIAKMAGLDPMGGTDPLAETVQWTEDRRPHTETRWANLNLASAAQTSALTVFIRVNSPFEHRGNHAFADAVRLVRAPASQFTEVTRICNRILVRWDGSLGPDIPAIPGTKHELSLEIQQRAAAGEWQPWLSGQDAGEAVFTPPPTGQDETYQFRIRAWGIQPAGEKGAWPDHHFVGVWHKSEEIRVPGEEQCPNALFLPVTIR